MMRSRLLFCCGLGVGAAACVPRPVPPVPATVVVYTIPWEDAFPSDVAVDQDGRLWFTDRLTHALGVFDPSTREFRRIETPTPRSAPYGLIRAPDGALWFGESNGGRLGRLDPRTGRITEVRVPGLRAGPRLLTWSGGAVWYTAQRDSAFGRYDPATGEHRVWRGRIGDPYGIASAGGQVWVSRQEGTRLYRVDGGAADGDSLPAIDLSEPIALRLSEAARRRLSPEAIRRITRRRRGAGTRRLVGGADGRIWIAEYVRGRVTGVDPETGDRIHVETLDQPSRPYGITVDAWDRVWFSEQGNGVVVVYDPSTARRHRIALPSPRGTVRHIVVDGERGRAWLPMSDAGAIAVVELAPSAATLRGTDP